MPSDYVQNLFVPTHMVVPGLQNFGSQSGKLKNDQTLTTGLKSL